MGGSFLLEFISVPINFGTPCFKPLPRTLHKNSMLEVKSMSGLRKWAMDVFMERKRHKMDGQLLYILYIYIFKHGLHSVDIGSKCTFYRVSGV